MNRPPIWFERKFDFTFSVEQYPTLCARLRGTPARLDEIIRGSTRSVLVRRPGEKWSAQEHAGHLLDLEWLWMARVENYFAEAPQLAVADLTNQNTWEAQYNERSVENILTEFRNARSRLLNLVEAVDATMFVRTIPHPRLRVPMRFVDHLFFVAEHDDHHLAHIWALINASHAQDGRAAHGDKDESKQNLD
jgi:uncharacterized damage-inducible protein DinB